MTEAIGMSKGEIGRRIRAKRHEGAMSLRQVAQAAGLSATHISEIERGHTTPTVGALVRIASALDCEPHFFLESRWLPEVSVIRATDGIAREQCPAHGSAFQRLTHGIPGGRLECYHVYFEPRREPPAASPASGEAAGYVLHGRLRLRVGDEERALGTGDAFHLRADLPHQLWNPGEETAEVIWTAIHPYAPPR